jgi:hydroxyacyl-ACP dehydratase HTD2-like protein with hotdog domain
MPKINELHVGDTIPERTYRPSNVSLFLYNAAIWNPHRIHYDERYTTEVEGHPGVVVDGPLQGDWLTQAVLEWLSEDGQLLEFEYSNRKASYVGARLTSTGRITAIDRTSQTVTLEIAIVDEKGGVLTPGTAVVRLNR